MIIFGTKVRHKKIAEGEFFCPKCQAVTRYVHKQAVRTFTLYFIPIFPIQQLGEFVECQRCGTALDPTVRHLRSKPTTSNRSSGQDLETVMRSIPSRLSGGYPVEYMIRDLTTAGLDLSIARGAVEGAVSSGSKVCDHCHLTYSGTADTCAECGGKLR